MEISRELLGNIYEALLMCKRFVVGEERRKFIQGVCLELAKELNKE